MIADCRAGRETGWHDLYNAYAGYVFTICRRYGIKEADEDDLVQEVFATLFNSFGTFDGKAEALKPWLRGITVNVCLQHLRAQRRGFVDYRDELPISNTSVELNTALNEMATDDIIRLIAALPEPHRCVFNMVVIEGQTYPAVARHLSITEANCRQYLSRARKKLRQEITALQKIAS